MAINLYKYLPNQFDPPAKPDDETYLSSQKAWNAIIPIAVFPLDFLTA
jgi:hypothetical protein